jgi:predicted phage terminase large subunit-like protein
MSGIVFQPSRRDTQALSGQSLIQELKRDTRLPIMPIKVDSDKLSRAYAVTPSIETGRVFLPESAPWLV